MAYILIPLLVFVAIGILCLNVRIGFWVADKTRGTGFDVGFYMMTVFGLIAAQVSLVLFLVNSY